MNLHTPSFNVRFSSLKDMRKIMYKRMRPEVEAVMVDTPHGKLTGLQILRAVSDLQEETPNSTLYGDTFLNSAAHPDDHDSVSKALSTLSELGLIKYEYSSYYGQRVIAMHTLGTAILAAAEEAQGKSIMM